MTVTKKSTKKESSVEEKKGGFLGKFVFAILFVALAVGGSFLLWQNYQLKASASDLSESGEATEMSETEIQGLLVKVRKHILLPAEEEPTIATIVDAEKLSQEQAFYKNVVDGDKVLIYMQAQKAIIYRESEDLLVNVGPVYTNNPEETATEEADTVEEAVDAVEQSEEALTIEVRNGSKTAGVAGALRDDLSSFDNFDVIDIGDANNKDFSETIIVDLTTGNKEAQLAELEKGLGISAVKDIPEGEEETGAEVLIIIGE